MCSEEEKQLEMLNALISHFDNKFEKNRKKQEKLAKGYLQLIVNSVVEKTNYELEQMNIPSFLELKNNKNLYHSEFKYAMDIFEMNLHEIMINIEKGIIKAFWEG